MGCGTRTECKRMNALIALMIIGGGIACVFALVSIWDKSEKARLLRQAEEATEKTANENGTARPGEPDEAWWGNRCLVLLYIEAAMVVTTVDKVAQVIPVRAIRECSSMGSINNSGTSRLMLSLNDPANPEVNLDFPGDGAMHAQRAISALIAMVVDQAEVAPPPVVSEEEEEEWEGEEAQAPEGMIDSTPRHASNIIMDTARHDGDKGETLVIG